MKKLFTLLLICIASFAYAQSKKLTKEDILKNGTTITYVKVKLYKSTGFGNPIKEREKRDTLKISIKEINNKLRVIINNNLSDENTFFIDSEKLDVFKTVIEPNTGESIQYIDFTLSKSQFNNEKLGVDEGTLYPRKYKKSDLREKITFLFNEKNITLPITYYKEENPDPYFAIDLAFLNLESFPIQTHIKYISDTEGYYSGSVFRLVSIETTE